MAISIKPAITLINVTQDKLLLNYGFSISLDGLEDTIDNLEQVLDVDFEELRLLNKESLMWYQYLSDLSSILSIYLDRFKNTYDVYDYLQKLSVKNINEFLKLAPKYKISTRDKDSAILEIASKKIEMSTFVKNLTALTKIINSYSRYMTFHYYRTSRLIKKSYMSYKNVADIT